MSPESLMSKFLFCLTCLHTYPIIGMFTKKTNGLRYEKLTTEM